MDIDIDQLFVQNSIENVEVKLTEMRKNIDKEKEELRLLVSERYRDLIAGADTIVAMETLSQRVCESVRRIETASDELHRRGLLGIQPHANTDSLPRLGSRERVYDIGARLKLLMDTPEMMWSRLEKNNLLDTALLTTLAQFVYAGVRDECISTNYKSLSASSRPVLDQFPVVARQRSVLNRVENAVLYRCRSAVKDASLSDILRVSHCLVAESLLSGTSDISAICLRFLQLRTNALLQTLAGNRRNSEPALTSLLSISDVIASSYESLTGCSAEKCRETDSPAVVVVGDGLSGDLLAKQMSHAVSIVIDTVKMIYAIFTDGALLSLTPSVTYVSQLSANQQRCPFSLVGERGLVALRFLADDIKLFRPVVVQKGIADFDGENRSKLSRLLQDWIQSLSDTVLPSVQLALQGVHHIADLTTVRDSVYDCLSGDPHRNVFSAIYRQLGVPAIDVWTLLLREPILSRADVVIARRVQSAFDAFVDEIKAFVPDSQRLESEMDVSKFRWTESSADISTPSIYTDQRSHDSTGHTLSGISLRRCCYTPPVQTFCQHLDTALRDIINDLITYTGRDGASDKIKAGSSMNKGGVSGEIKGSLSVINGLSSTDGSDCADAVLFDRWADCTRLGETLKECVRSQLTSLPQRMTRLVTDLSSSSSSPSPEHVSVLLMRVARALTDLVTSLTSCLDPPVGTRQLSGSSRHLWHQLVSELLACRSSSLCQPWMCALVARATDELRHTMTTLPLHDVSEFTVWRTETVAEEQSLLNQQNSDHQSAEISNPPKPDNTDTVTVDSSHQDNPSQDDANDDITSSSHRDISSPRDDSAVPAVVGEERSRQGIVRIPVAVRQSLSRAVYSVCRQMSLVGAATFGKEVQITFVSHFVNEIISVYEHCYCATQSDSSKNDHQSALLSQNQAIQSLFDLRFLRCLLAGRVDQAKSKRFAAIRRSIEQWVDPFDLAVIQPRLQNSVNSYLTQTQTLFGALIPDRLTLTSSSSSLASNRSHTSPASTNSASIVPLPPRAPRFPLLPVADLVAIESSTRLNSRTAPSVGREEELETTSKATFAGLDLVLPSTRKLADSLRPSAASFLANLGSNWLSG